MLKRQHRGPDKCKYRRGRVAGLIPIQFLSEMVELSYFVTYRVMKKWLKEANKTEQELTPRDVAKFVEFVYDRRRIEEEARKIEFME